MANAQPPAVFLLGPTASGKTALAVELVQKFPLEIVSVDSAMIYRGMDIGTAKPDAATLEIAPHRLIDIVDPTERYSAGRFRQDALRHMAEITAGGKVPLLVGGTMLYFKALAEGLSRLPTADPVLRGKLDARAAVEGWPALHAGLARLDPETAARLKPTDAQRIQRALEVCMLAGEPMSAVLRRERGAALPYRALQLALIPADRAELHRRIARRFEAMLAAGLVGEVRGLRARYPLHADLPSMRCVGYRQVWQYLEGEFDHAALAEKGIAATRQLAKRQLTWLRGLAGLETLAEDGQPVGRVIERIGPFLEGG
jgi:tRNA dimethylallyltransferase